MSRTMNRAPRARRGSTLALVMAAAVSVAWWALGAAPASAHIPVPEPHAACATTTGWVIDYDVASWSTDEALGAGNPHVEVAYQVDDGDWVTLPWDGTHRFDADNGYAFAGTFDLPAGPATRLRLKSWATGEWSDHKTFLDEQLSEWVDLPRDCEGTQATTTTAAPTTTTTAPTTTVAVAPTSIVGTTTTAPEVTTTTTPGTTAPTTATPTTEQAVLPTSIVNTTTTTTGPETATAVLAETVSQLPVTGAVPAVPVALAAGLILGGAALVRRARG